MCRSPGVVGRACRGPSPGERSRPELLDMEARQNARNPRRGRGFRAMELARLELVDSRRPPTGSTGLTAGRADDAAGDEKVTAEVGFRDFDGFRIEARAAACVCADGPASLAKAEARTCGHPK